MNVNLTPELEELVQTKVQSGRYNSVSEVVREALRLMEQKDEVRAGRGEGTDGEVFQRMIKNLDTREAKRKSHA
jgi:antitoxin ParD1/3/4